MIEVKEGSMANVRQIGHIGNEKVYIEDYVVSFLKQCIRDNQNEQAFVLYGRKEYIDKKRTWFVSSVLKVPQTDAHKKTLTVESDWHVMNEQAAKFFPGQAVVGLAMYGTDELAYCEERIENTFVHFLREDQKLFLFFDEEELDGELFFYEQDKLVKQEGFFEYYEKNEPMQNYMLYDQEQKGEIKTGANETSETGNDHATRQFRAMLAQKKKENAHKKALVFMYGLSAVLAVVIVAIGITIIQNYDQMNDMQNVLSKLSGQVETGFAQEQKQNDEDMTAAESVPAVPKEEETVTGLEEGKREESVEVVAREDVQQNDIVQTDEVVHITQEQKEEADVVQKEETAVPAFYEIRKGDTLEKISIRFYGDDRKIKAICELNHIEDQDTILYGQKIVLP